jgi:hypothetical protein
MNNTFIAETKRMRVKESINNTFIAETERMRVKERHKQYLQI